MRLAAKVVSGFPTGAARPDDEANHRHRRLLFRGAGGGPTRQGHRLGALLAATAPGPRAGYTRARLNKFPISGLVARFC